VEDRKRVDPIAEGANGVMGRRIQQKWNFRVPFSLFFTSKKYYYVVLFFIPKCEEVNKADLYTAIDFAIFLLIGILPGTRKQ